MESYKIGEIQIVYEDEGGAVAYGFTKSIDDIIQLDTNKDLHDRILANVAELHDIICDLSERSKIK